MTAGTYTQQWFAFLLPPIQYYSCTYFTFLKKENIRFSSFINYFLFLFFRNNDSVLLENADDAVVKEDNDPEKEGKDMFILLQTLYITHGSVQ